MFRKLDLFQCNQHIREHTEHRTNFIFAHAQLQAALGKQRKCNPATQKYTKCTHLKYLPGSSVHCLYYEPYPPTPGATISVQFQISLHPPFHMVQPFWHPCLPENIVFFEVKCHIYYDILNSSQFNMWKLCWAALDFCLFTCHQSFLPLCP